MTDHDRAAIYIARRYGVLYNKDKGADVITSQMAIEVESYNSVPDAERQLASYRFRRRFVAGANKEATARAKSYYKGKHHIGIMDEFGNIIRNSALGGFYG